MEDVTDVLGAIGFVGDGFPDGADEGRLPVNQNNTCELRKYLNLPTAFTGGLANTYRKPEHHLHDFNQLHTHQVVILLRSC